MSTPERLHRQETLQVGEFVLQHTNKFTQGEGLIRYVFVQRADAQQASAFRRIDFQKSGVSEGPRGAGDRDQSQVVVGGTGVGGGARAEIDRFVEPCESGLPGCDEGVGGGGQVPALGGRGVGVGEVH